MRSSSFFIRADSSIFLNLSSSTNLCFSLNKSSKPPSRLLISSITKSGALSNLLKKLFEAFGSSRYLSCCCKPSVCAFIALSKKFDGNGENPGPPGPYGIGPKSGPPGIGPN